MPRDPKHPPIFPFARSRVFSATPMRNNVGLLRPMLELEQAERAVFSPADNQKRWRQLRADALRVLARIEELSVEELWTPTLDDVAGERVTIHIELSDMTSSAELARGLEVLRKAAAEVAP